MSGRRFGRRARLAAGTALAVVLATTLAPANAPPGRYRVLEGEPGIVYDHETGLRWVQSNLIGPVTLTGGDGGATACASLVMSAGTWRLPTVGELLTLVDFTQTKAPFIDSNYFSGAPASNYWSATRVVDTTEVWAVDFGESTSQLMNTFDPATSSFYIRCVQ